MNGDVIELVTPVGREWQPVFRLVLGGVADRVGLGFEQLDDVQLAVERLLAEGARGEDERVRLVIELADGALRLRLGPLRSKPIKAALEGAPPNPGELTLRRILETVVDSFSVEEGADGEVSVALEQRVRG